MFPKNLDIITPPDDRIVAYSHDAVMAGTPSAVIRPRDWREVSEILSWCNGQEIPLTVCGARTSMTGASVAESGVLMTTDRFNKIIDISIDGCGMPYAIVEPGIVVGEFQKAANEQGFQYPVAPTSVNEAFIGGTVATNATGEDFYKYGPTRTFVRELSYIKMDGTAGVLKRRTLSPLPARRKFGGGRGLGEGRFSKSFGGYFLDGEEIDHLIGSEGTLAVINRIVVELLPYKEDAYIILFPFGSNASALSFIDDVNKSKHRPRALEYVDTNALDIMKTHPTAPKFSEKVKALVYLKDEGEIADHPSCKCHALIEDESIVAATEKQKADIHAWRHHIPASTTEWHEKALKTGGCKVAGDWWAPRERMLEMMRIFYDESLKSGLKFLAYGHLGDGHPHTNYLCNTPEEKSRAHELVIKLCRKAVEFGGGVAAEHGIGKIKRELLSIAHSPEIIAKMRALKEHYDPKWLLGRGNIFRCI